MEQSSYWQRRQSPPPRDWQGKENVLWPGGAMSRHFASSPTGYILFIMKITQFTLLVCTLALVQHMSLTVQWEKKSWISSNDGWSKSLKEITLTSTVSVYHSVEESWMFVEYVICATKQQWEYDITLMFPHKLISALKNCYSFEKEVLH